MEITQTLPFIYHSGKAEGALTGIGGCTANIGVLVTTFTVLILIVGDNYNIFFSMPACLVPLAS